MTQRTCLIDGCTNNAQSRGWCSKHYTRWLRHGDPLGGGAFREVKPIATCSVEGCESDSLARGWCVTHWQRWNKHGDPLKVVNYSNPQDAIKTRTKWVDGCLIWQGGKTPQGYGIIKVKQKSIRLHRYIYESFHGKIPEGKMIDHICHKPDCVNISHLRVATAAQNSSYLSGPNRGSTSGQRNVYKSGDKWRVRVEKGGYGKDFGTYNTIEEAAAVAEQARKDLFGEFAGRG